MRLEFGRFLFDSSRCAVFDRGREVRLTRKAFLLLELLVEHRPQVVSKRRIMDHLWPECFVTEGNVASLVSEIREGLGREGAAFIRTAHGVGYSFQVEEARADAAMPRFVLIEKGPPPRSIDLHEGEILLGRATSCDVRVSSKTVSRTHARIRLAGEGATLEDLDSRNGTFLKGERLLRQTALRDGDEIRIGSVELVFRETADPDRATEPVA
jgi:DNA-binding winged helix-turn-helix (wHTH) protein